MDIRVSIVTVCFNSEKTIEQTFKSLLFQTDLEFEYVVVDGASKDSTLEIIRKYKPLFEEKGIIFRYVSEKDNGIYDAMNKGIRLASGDVVGLLNSDDYYLSDTIHKLKEIITKYPKMDVIHGCVINKHNDEIISVIGNNSDILSRGMIQHPACFVKKNTYEKYGLYNTKYRYAADYDFMIRLKRQGSSFFFVPEIFAVFNEDGAGNCRKSRNEAYKLMLNNGFISIIKYFVLLLKNYLR